MDRRRGQLRVKSFIPLSVRSGRLGEHHDALVRDAAAEPAAAAPVDGLGRRLRDLRISVTDRCNFRCVYCMPKDVFGRDYPFLAHSDLLSFEEITRLARVFKALGVQKVRLTGGEPLLRRSVERLVEMLAGIGGLDLTLTTNGALLARKARALKDAGLGRVTVSLDSLDDAVFRRMNDVDFPVANVLAGIDAAAAAGLAPVKLNMVVKRGMNAHEILPMARRFRGTGHILRFIEFMDVGATNGWRMDDVLPAREVVRTIDAEMPLEPVDANYAGEVAAALALPRRRRRDRRDRLGHAGVLPRLHARAAVDRGQALYLPVRRPGLGPARAAARRRFRRRPRRGDPCGLDPPRRSLLGDPHHGDCRAPEGRDELHRRVATRRRSP